MGGHPRIVLDSLGIHGVHGYSDTGGQSQVYILRLSGIFWVWSVMDGYLWIVQVFLVYMDTLTQGASLGYSGVYG